MQSAHVHSQDWITAIVTGLNYEKNSQRWERIIQVRIRRTATEEKCTSDIKITILVLTEQCLKGIHISPMAIMLRSLLFKNILVFLSSPEVNRIVIIAVFMWWFPAEMALSGLSRIGVELNPLSSSV